MDLSGTKARYKKFAILKRLHDIEIDVLQGSYEEARKKAQKLDGIELLKDLGFNCSVENRLATKKDIATFLKISESTLTSFLRKNQDQIKPIPLELSTIRHLGSTASRMNAYNLNDVLKVCFWIQSEMGIELKKRLLGETSILLRKDNRKEIEWRVVLGKVFAGLDLAYSASIGSYKVDFLIGKLALVLEYDEDHSGYNLAAEEEREKYISRHYTLIRFNEQTSLEDLVNAILKAQIKQVIRLYN